ncbi:hypothetical protein OUZ56_028349 [Daphnia magna]|uniref:Uncharacterized protein n=1 Tax=Daphnia magna TaxID=35525 RepID=A0ABR0B3K8_9CRUS|nr:hypothetical protein OUZ56_028349 [Daphnia magna]
MELSFSGRLGYHCELGAMQDADTWNMVCHTPYFDLTLFSFSPQGDRRKERLLPAQGILSDWPVFPISFFLLGSTSLGLIPVRTWVDSPLPHSPKDGFIIGRKEKERERPQQLANLFHEFRPCVFGMKSS